MEREGQIIVGGHFCGFGTVCGGEMFGPGMSEQEKYGELGTLSRGGSHGSNMLKPSGIREHLGSYFGAIAPKSMGVG